MAKAMTRMIRRRGADASVNLCKRRCWYVDVTQTPANVIGVAGSPTRQVAGGAAAMVAGDWVYDDGTNGVKLADASAVATAKCIGILQNGGGIAQPLTVQTDGDVNPGGTLVIGVTYVLSATAGKMAPEADVGSGEVKVTLGIATTTSNLQMALNPSEVLGT